MFSWRCLVCEATIHTLSASTVPTCAHKKRVTRFNQPAVMQQVGGKK